MVSFTNATRFIFIWLARISSSVKIERTWSAVGKPSTWCFEMARSMVVLPADLAAMTPS